MEKHILEAGVTNLPHHARETYTQGSITHTFNGTVVETPKNVQGGDDSKPIMYFGIAYDGTYHPNFDGTLGVDGGNIENLDYLFLPNFEEYPANLSFDLRVTNINGDEIMHFNNTYFSWEYDDEDGVTYVYFDRKPDNLTSNNGRLTFTISDADTGETLSTVGFGYEQQLK